MKKHIHENKPVIESIINTVAIAFTSYGVLQVTTGHMAGYLPIMFGVGLEMLKYYGRNKEYW